MEFKENICLYLLHSHEKDRKRFKFLSRDSLETAELYGIFGFVIASVLKSSQASRSSKEMIAIAREWRVGWSRFHSTMLTFAENLLFTGEQEDQSLKHSYTLGNADMQVRCAMAMAMIERNHHRQAHGFLTTCVKDFRSADSVYLDEYFPVMTELVKCCNILNQEEQAEATALEALQHRYSNNATRNEICNMQIALADSLIGRSKYNEAGKLLEKMLASESLSTYLTTVASLRLNKIKRRLSVSDTSAFNYNGALQKALTCASESNDHLRVECLEELSCTVSFAQQRTTENVPEVETVLSNASILVAKQPASTNNWRTRMLQEQLMHLSGGETKERQQGSISEVSDIFALTTTIIKTIEDIHNAPAELQNLAKRVRVVNAFLGVDYAKSQHNVVMNSIIYEIEMVLRVMKDIVTKYRDNEGQVEFLFYGIKYKLSDKQGITNLVIKLEERMIDLTTLFVVQTLDSTNQLRRPIEKVLTQTRQDQGPAKSQSRTQSPDPEKGIDNQAIRSDQIDKVKAVFDKIWQTERPNELTLLPDQGDISTEKEVALQLEQASIGSTFSKAFTEVIDKQRKQLSHAEDIDLISYTGYENRSKKPKGWIMVIDSYNEGNTETSDLAL